MIGIYKITNKLNGMIYIGESVRIERRFMEHNMKSHNSQLIDQAINKYGINNFTYEIIEECPIEQLIEREHYWIKYYDCISPKGYNKAQNSSLISTVYHIPKETVDNIRNDLINTELSISKIAEKYSVGISTVSRINNGKIYILNNLDYPLHQTQPKNKNYCIDCGKEISYYACRCQKCANIIKQNVLPISREELKEMIRNIPFETIGKRYNISGNAIKKWCDKYNLPRTKKEIKQYSNKEWEEV